MDTEDLDELLTLLRKHDVSVYKTGETVIQLNPKPIEFGEPETAPAVAGGWKRQANLDRE